MSLFMVGGEGPIEKGPMSWILLFIFLEVVPYLLSIITSSKLDQMTGFIPKNVISQEKDGNV